jgi:muramoyltetrapeptide carboxypeptidase
MIIPNALKLGDTIGICTPSVPAYVQNPEMFEIACSNIQKHGFAVKLGHLTARRHSEGYRSGAPEERANEIMALFKDKNVAAIITTIGGSNSSSLIPYLDFEVIKKHPKIFCGYSDVSSLHLAINKFSNLATYYGPGLMPHWGDYPDGILESITSFLEATTNEARTLRPFPRWSNHFRSWNNLEWKKVSREWKSNEGWKILYPGECEGQVVISNLNTLISAAGTKYFPELKDKILFLEEMYAPLSRFERNLRQIQLMGGLDNLKGLIIGKPEVLDLEGAPFGLDHLIGEIVGKRDYPIITEFDCSHTVPMHTMRQGSKIRLCAKEGVTLTSIEIIN